MVYALSLKHRTSNPLNQTSIFLNQTSNLFPFFSLAFEGTKRPQVSLSSPYPLKLSIWMQPSWSMPMKPIISSSAQRRPMGTCVPPMELKLPAQARPTAMSARAMMNAAMDLILVVAMSLRTDRHAAGATQQRMDAVCVRFHVLLLLGGEGTPGGRWAWAWAWASREVVTWRLLPCCALC